MLFVDELCVAGNETPTCTGKALGAFFPALGNVKLHKKERIEVGTV